ncbi:hypothetical protein ACFQY0_20385 [Haloferula chungangensis]|uniref:Uncharacterized protein n=1 Tax=Haloferula chungangensis TaxID=1048331 RepID=A0ABW2LFJ9_9BACT
MLDDLLIPGAFKDGEKISVVAYLVNDADGWVLYGANPILWGGMDDPSGGSSAPFVDVSTRIPAKLSEIGIVPHSMAGEDFTIANDLVIVDGTFREGEESKRKRNWVEVAKVTLFDNQ